MQSYPSRHNDKLDSSELDPCLAAESRMKASVLTDKMKRILLIAAVVFLLVLVLSLIVVVLFMKSENESVVIEYDQHVAEIDPMDLEDVEEDGLFGKKNDEPVALQPIIKQKPKETTSYTPTRLPYTTTKPKLVHIAVETTAFVEPTTTSTTRTTTTTTSTTSTTTTTTPIRTTTVFPMAGNYQPAVPTLGSSFPLTPEIKKTCKDHLDEGLGSGVYYLSPDGGQRFSVFCDMETDGGGWTVIQRRVDGKMVFYNRTYSEYATGFGNLASSHWLGLDLVNRIAPTNRSDYILRIEMRGDTCIDCGNPPDIYIWGEWGFSIAGSSDHYRLSVSAHQLHGNMSESHPRKTVYWNRMSNGQEFTAYDRDYDKGEGLNCAQFRNYGGWWHKDCSTLSLNGVYGDTKGKLRYLVYLNEKANADGDVTVSYIHPRQTLMMIRPRY